MFSMKEYPVPVEPADKPIGPFGLRTYLTVWRLKGLEKRLYALLADERSRESIDEVEANMKSSVRSHIGSFEAATICAAMSATDVKYYPKDQPTSDEYCKWSSTRELLLELDHIRAQISAVQEKLLRLKGRIM